MSRRTYDLGWVLFGLALALRVGWILYRGTMGGGGLEFPDERVHWELARNLVETGTMVTDDGRYAARMPVYPLFLALFASLDQVGIFMARLAQAVLGAGTVLLVYRLGLRALNERVGFVGGLIAALDPFGVFFANALLTEVLFTFFAVALTGCAWRFLLYHRPFSSLLGLALFGAAAIMTRPSAALWIPLLWLLLLIRTPDRRRATLQLLLCPVVLVLLLLPWGLRNRAVLGDYAWLSANGGLTLFDAQGPQADGSSDQAFLDAMPELAEMNEVQRDHVLQRAAFAQMRADPWRVVRLAGVKFARLWNPVPNNPEYQGGAAAVACATYTMVVLFLALAGLLRAAFTRTRPYQLTFWRVTPGVRTLHVLLWTPVVYFTLLHMVYIGSVRYRVPLMPFLALAAATAVVPPRAEHPINE